MLLSPLAKSAKKDTCIRRDGTPAAEVEADDDDVAEAVGASAPPAAHSTELICHTRTARSVPHVTIRVTGAGADGVADCFCACLATDTAVVAASTA
jgi:hypothetical protein